MAPAKNSKKKSVAAKSTPKQVDSDKKSLKRLRKTDKADESTSEKVDCEKIMVEEEKGVDPVESVPAPKVRKPCTWLKLDRVDFQVGGKSALKSCKQDKESKTVSEVQSKQDDKGKGKRDGEERGNLEKGKRIVGNRHEEPTKDNKRKRAEEGEEKGDARAQKHNGRRHHDKEKGIVNDRHKDRTKEDEKFGNELGGLIFMCNAKTKPDCFHYQLMGIPINKKEVVMNIKKPGLKLFLYDYDLKIMYGIYEAASAGGMKLEPAAFGGGFPAQVRFRVYKDCTPLPESMFKKAIKDSYDERTHKFKTELTVNQVKHLMDMFRPTPWLHPNGKSNAHEVGAFMHPPTVFRGEEPHERQRYRNNYGVADKQDPLFVTEQEYRNYGLRQGRHLSAGDDGSNNRAPNIDHELTQLLRDPARSSTEAHVPQRDVNQSKQLFLSEQDYRAYGLRAGHQHIPNAAPSTMTSTGIDNVAYDPYDVSTDSLVNRYLVQPTSIPAESHQTYPITGREPYGNYLYQPSERAFTSYSLGDQSDFSRRQYSLQASHEPSQINQGFSVQRETSVAPVSQRYSFAAGPTTLQHR